MVSTPHAARIPAVAYVVLALLGLLGQPGTARAQGVLDKSAQPRIQEALKPYGLGEVVVEPWRIMNIALVFDRVEIELASPAKTVILHLVPRGQSVSPRAQSASFDVVAPAAPDGSATFDAAVDALSAALKKGDKGGFFVSVGSRSSPDKEGSEPSRSPPSPAPVPIFWVMLVGVLLLYLLALLGHRKPVLEEVEQGPAREELVLFVALALLAVGLRFSLGPYSLLHENYHAPVLLEQLAGSATHTRPMAGLVGIHQLLDLFGPFTFERLFALAVFFSALQPLFAFKLARALGCRPSGALIAGLVVATSPLYLRLASSELAFVPGTTFLLAAAWMVVEAARRDSGALFAAACLSVSLAGHFRPLLYTAIVPLLVALWMSTPQERRAQLMRRRSSWLALGVLALFSLDDVGPILASLGEGTALAPGWWQGERLHSWPLFDPEVTPWWILAPSCVGLVALLWRGKAPRRRAALWLLFFLAWLSFWLTSMNGWPSALRYASSYAWIPALWLALSFEEAVETVGRSRTWLAIVGLVVLLPPLTHGEWIDHHYAPQVEIAFQRDVVLPHLASSPPGTIVTPWRELDGIGGSFLAGSARAMGHRIVPHSLAQTSLEGRDSQRALYWYRGLTCWSRSVSGPTGSYDEVGMNEICRKIEASYLLEPVMILRLAPLSDADWIQIGDGQSEVEIGLFRMTR